MPEPLQAPRPILFYRVDTETFQRVTNLLLALQELLELPKINAMLRELELNTRAVHPPDPTLDGHLKDDPPAPADPPKAEGKKNGQGDGKSDEIESTKEGLESAEKEH